KKTYKFALKSALYITLLSAGALLLFTYIDPWIDFYHTLVFAFILFLFSFFVIQYRVEHFIYRRVKKIYDDVSLLDSSTFRNQAITTDMATLTREVEKFATDKKL
ncbi:hypothetical protein RZS08_64620, partial [Arthrospira platensis SPKY1]|nr:hypothetical protein [Arthrospira platensis SPKY1]